MSSKPRVVLPKLLLEHGLADIQTIGMATGIAAEGNVSIAHALVRWRFVPADGLCGALAKALDMAPTLPVADRAAAGLVRRTLCSRLRVLPLWQRSGVLCLAMTDPSDDAAAAAVAQHTALKIERVLVNDDDLEDAILRAYDDGAQDDARSTIPEGSSTSPPAQSMAVVLGEPSTADVRIQDANSEMFVDPVSVGDRDFTAEPSSVFTNRTIDMPMSRGTSVANQKQRPRPVVLEQATSVGRAVITSPPPIGQKVVSVTPTPPAPLPGSVNVAPAPRLAKLSGADSADGPPKDITGPMPWRGTQLDVSGDALFDKTREVDLNDTARLLAANAPNALEDPTTVMGAIAVVHGQVSEDRTIPSDDLLFIMRVLVVASDARQRAFNDALHPRIKSFSIANLAAAPALLEQKRFDEVVVIDPDNTVAASQQLALVAARAKRGVAVLTNNADIARLPGVRQCLPLGGGDDELARKVLALLKTRALA